VCKKSITKSQPFVKKRKKWGGDFFDSHCMLKPTVSSRAKVTINTKSHCLFCCFCVICFWLWRPFPKSEMT